MYVVTFNLYLDIYIQRFNKNYSKKSIPVMKKESKNQQRLVQKQTFPKSIQFQPKVLHKVKRHHENDQSFFNSFRNILESKLFPTQPNHHSPNNSNAKNKSIQQKTQIGSNRALQKMLSMESSAIKSKQRHGHQQSLEALKSPKLSDEVDKGKYFAQGTVQKEQFEKVIQQVYLKIKYVVKMSEDCVLIGNQNQLDLVKFKNTNRIPDNSKKWSMSLEKPIEGVTSSVLSQSKILLWTQNQLYIYECNHKKITLQPKLVSTVPVPSQRILSAQFVQHNIFLICCHNHIEIHELIQTNKQYQLVKLFYKAFQCPKHYQVVEVPQLVDNNIKIFFANMKQYPQEISGLQKRKDVFGLYFVEIQYDCAKTKISELKKVYEIKKSLRYQIKLFNLNVSIFLMNLKTEVLVVKNGLIIDSVGVNFKFDHCYLKVIRKNQLVHILTDKIQFYRIRLNQQVMPQKIIVEPFDSIYFPRNLQDPYISIVPVNEGYGLFFQTSLQQLRYPQLKKGIVKYWYNLTYPVPLSSKLDQIFPERQKISGTTFQALDMMCDMAVKMGLTESQAYRQIWKKSSKETEKDYEILLASKNYSIISQQIVSLLKKRSERFRLISKNQLICLDILRTRIFRSNCSIQNIQQFSYCHFFNMKLKTYKDIWVQKKRFQIQRYKKLIQPNESNIESILLQISQNNVAPHQNIPSMQKQQSIREGRQPQWQLQQGMALQQRHVFDQDIQTLIQRQDQINRLKAEPQLFATYLKTSKRIQAQQQDQKISQLREMSKLRHSVQSKIKDQEYREIRINIKDYYFYRDCHLKHFFMQIVSQLMNKQTTVNDHLRIFNLRVLIRNFRLHYRLIFQDILSDIIYTYKHKVSRLIQCFRELLPFQAKNTSQGTDESLFLGIWSQIRKQQVDDCLFLNDMITIQNKETVQNFKQTLSFKRNSLTHHGVLTESKEQILSKFSAQNMKKTRDHYFYLFYQKFIQIKISQQKQLQEARFQLFGRKLAQTQKRILVQQTKINQLFQGIEEIYQLMPQHLKGFIRLYQHLYLFLEKFPIQEKKYNNVYDFLKLRQFELFSIFFGIERKFKGFIIKQILHKYQDPELLENGREKFIRAIGQYFDSELSQVTDLKTILNRLNGQNREFHIKFQSLYDCLLSAMLKKIKIGTSQDVPLQQLLIYVENIPFQAHNRNIFEKLLFIKQVHHEALTLQRAKLNMSIAQIKDNPELVIAALVETQLDKQDVLQSTEITELRMYFWKCLSELLSIKRHFYGNQYDDFLVFIFVTELLQKEALIPLVNEILADSEMREMLQISDDEGQTKLRKAAVFYCFKRRLAGNCSDFLYSQEYIKKLLKLIKKQDQQRVLIELQIKYCHIFKRCNYTIPYPLSIKREIPMLEQIQYHIQNIASQDLSRIEIGALFRILEDMREIIQPKRTLMLTRVTLDWKVKQFQKILYENVFFKLLRENSYKKALEIIQKFISLGDQADCTIYNVLLIDSLLDQFNDNTGKLLIKLISCFYFDVKQLCDIIRVLLSNPLTSRQIQNFFQLRVDNRQNHNLNSYYNPNNLIFADQVIDLINNDQNVSRQDFCDLFDTVYQHLEKSSQYIQNNKYFQILYRLMLINPYQISKFVYRKQGEINIKALRAFFSFMSSQIVFNPQIILKVGKIIFLIILNRMRDGVLLSQQIKQYSSLNLIKQTYDEQQIERKFSSVSLSTIQKLIYESYLVMKRKLIEYYQNDLTSKINKQMQRVKKLYDKDLFLVKKNKIQHIQKSGVSTYASYDQWINLPIKIKYFLKNLSQLASYKGFAYLFTCDKDDSYVNKGTDEFVCPMVEEWPKARQFNKTRERHEILVRGEYTRVIQEQIISKARRPRRKSKYLPDQFVLQKKSTQKYGSMLGSRIIDSNSQTFFQQNQQQVFQKPKFIKRTFQKDLQDENVPPKVQQPQKSDIFTFLRALENPSH